LKELPVLQAPRGQHCRHARALAGYVLHSQVCILLALTQICAVGRPPMRVLSARPALVQMPGLAQPAVQEVSTHHV